MLKHHSLQQLRKPSTFQKEGKRRSPEQQQDAHKHATHVAQTN